MTNSSQKSSGVQSNGIKLRELREADRAPLLDILRRTAVFSEEEIDVALELIDAGLYKPDGDGYYFVVAEDSTGAVVAYSCYGPTPLTDGVYDLYWIAVDPRTQGRGVGRVILAATEEIIRGRGGRIVLIETASKEEYANTRGFYLATGYIEEARVRDFYHIGDDKIIYAKRLG